MVDRRILLINNQWVWVRFTQAARRHRIGRAHVMHVLLTTPAFETTTRTGDRALLWVGRDRAGRELEVIAVRLHDVAGMPILLVIHVFPTALREGR